MIIYHLKDLILRKSATEGRKITYANIAEATGISKITLSRMASKRGYNAGADIIEKLCIYFNTTPDELMTIIPDPPEE
ncbi:conserved hypothetical protein [delta proteobacterium NaphS2]|nr:conserved hypothetical protein [delta proteobacterium NaphS2]